ncbi:hypothetical protein NA57DRAFT_74203 [Rhizodiscina lignyota]|uniref:BZIP domain-containing protein n=1 Tax=Rhizodiscina lignyota TaxID=1504668 RepID=A0A9P4M7E2_9PEZI|nr:hypothetical protein NA57DRAFT_74203 [Rhizodiscina lignyota]
MPSSDSEGTSQAPNSRKRQRTATKAGKDGEDAKKARGRPRVEAQDETAADRRRTQIRLAQRAYRQRKETTIASLKKQVGDLQSTIDEMNKSFLNFNDRAVSSGVIGLNADLARELRATTEHFLTLARNASSGASGSDGEDQEEEQLAIEAPRKSKPTPTTGPHEQELDLTMNESNVLRDIGWGYTQTIGDTSNSSSTRASAEPQNEFLPGVKMNDAPHLLQRFRESNSTLNLPFFGLDDLQASTTTGDEIMDITSNSNAHNYGLNLSQFNAMIPSPPAISDKAQVDSSATLTLADGPFAIFPSASRALATPPIASPMISTKLGLPYTYSFQETTFARRLHRAAIERGFHLISQAELRPQRFAEVFGLTLRFSTRNDVRARLRQILSRGPGESLDNHGGPYLNFGGAGTHYAKRDSDRNIIKGSQKRIGPFGRLPQLQNTEQSIGMDLAETMMLSQTDDQVPDGYEGEWLDPTDVEGYLQERGLKLEAQAHFVEGEVSDIDEEALGPEILSSTPTVSNDFSPPYARSPNTVVGLGEKDKRSGESPWNGIFHDLAAFDRVSGFDTNSLFPDGMGLDFGGIGRINDFSSSAWFDDPNFGSGTSPVLTTGSTAESVNEPAMEFSRGGATGTAMVSAKRRKRSVTVDVGKMIDELIRGAVCLGRTPGFRRTDVDQALHNSLIAVH